MGVAGRTRAVEDFSWATIAERTVEVAARRAPDSTPSSVVPPTTSRFRRPTTPARGIRVPSVGKVRDLWRTRIGYCCPWPATGSPRSTARADAHPDKGRILTAASLCGSTNSPTSSATTLSPPTSCPRWRPGDDRPTAGDAAGGMRRPRLPDRVRSRGLRAKWGGAASRYRRDFDGSRLPTPIFTPPPRQKSEHTTRTSACWRWPRRSVLTRPTGCALDVGPLFAS